MPQLIRNHALADDRYTLLRDAATFADLPDGVPVIVPLSLWLERRSALIARGDIGVWLAPADHPGALADDLEHVQVIAIDFPQFTTIDSIEPWTILRLGTRNRFQTRRDNTTFLWMELNTFVDVRFDRGRVGRLAGPAH